MKKYKVRQILNRVKDAIVIENGQEYKRLTIRMYHKGVCLRDIERGENIGTKNQFVAQSGQFIMSRIDARNGAFGIIPETIDHAVITNDFLTFTVNEKLVDIVFFKLYSQTDNFMKLCIEGSKGTTNRKRLKEEVFLEFEINLPSLEEQAELVNK
jgi:restriction endonuclease S subunit